LQACRSKTCQLGQDCISRELFGGCFLCVMMGRGVGKILKARRLLSGFTVLVLCCTGRPPAYAGSGPGLQIMYTSPLPNSRYILPGTNIILRVDHVISAPPRLIRTVTGTRTGAHSYSARVSDDGRTLLCQPESPFAAGEVVTVRIDTSIAKEGESGTSGLFTFAIAGQIPEYTAYRTQLRGADFPGSVARPAGTALRGPSGGPDDVVLPNIDVTLSTATSPGYLFLSDLLWSVPTTPALLILRNDGSQVFARDLENSAYDFKPQPNGMLTYFDDGSGAFLVMDKTCTVVDTIKCGNGYATDPHELQILPNGHALLLGVDNEVVDMSALVPGGSRNAVVVGCIIQELDQSRNVVFQWRSWDHYNITDAQHVDLTAGWIDDVHGNSVDMDTDGNILFSSRHMNEITKINRQTGKTIWRLGGMNNQFRFINDSLGFSFQHAARRIANGDITLFDNGDFHVPPFSRALEYALDEELMTATLVWQYRNTPDVFGFAMGFVQRMENGNTLISWGAGNPTVTEVTATGTKVFEMTFDAGVYSYRAFRYDWQPAATSTGVNGAPSTYMLAPNYPNPFNPATTIQFSIARQSRVTLEVFNLLGERVSTLVDEQRPAGSYSERLDGTRLASGVYFYRLKAGDFTATRRMVLLR
jgi:hypothetical protein